MQENKGTEHGLSRILGGSALVFTCRVTGAALTLLLQVTLARWIGATELGVYVLAFSWCILLATVSQLGFANAAVRIIGQALGQKNPGVIWGFLKRGAQIVSTSSLIFALVGATILMLFGVADHGEGNRPFLIAMATIPILALISSQCTVAVAFRWLDLAFIPSEVARPISLFAIVAAIWLMTGELTATQVMLAQVAVMLATALFLFAILRRRLRRAVEPTPPTYETRHWARTAAPLLVVSLFANYFPEIMLIMLGPHVASDQIAIFNASYRLALVVNFGLGAVDAVCAPLAARLYAAGEFSELQAVVSRSAQLGFLGSLVALAGYSAFGSSLLGLFGSEFVAGYETMLILIAALVVRAAAGPVISLLSVTGHQDRCLAVFASALVLSLILVNLLVPSYGIRGAAVTVLIVTMGWSVWLHRLVVAHIGIRPSVLGSLGRVLARE